MSNHKELIMHLSRVLEDLREAVDASVDMRSKGKAEAGEVARIWESFLGAFFSYIVKKGHETGQNLLSGISFSKVWRR